MLIENIIQVYLKFNIDTYIRYHENRYNITIIYRELELGVIDVPH